MLRELLFGCSHLFSWPMKRPGGSLYQVCLRCGAEYGYDWERMQRTTVLHSRIIETQLSEIDETSVFKSRSGLRSSESTS